MNNVTYDRRTTRTVSVYSRGGAPRVKASGKNWCMHCLAYLVRLSEFDDKDDPGNAKLKAKIKAVIASFEKNNPERALELRKRVAKDMTWEIAHFNRQEWISLVCELARLTIVTNSKGTRFARLKK